MLHVLLSQADSYHDVVDHLSTAGARVTLIGPQSRRHAIPGKRAILQAMFSRNLLRARQLWTESDRVLVVGWQALPILLLIRLGLLRRPAKLLVMACFIHGARARSVVNRAWRLLRFPGLGFVTFSLGEARNLTEVVGIDPAMVHFHLWRQKLGGQTPADQISDDGYIFTGGFSNRDYNLLLSATSGTGVPVVVVASQRNDIDPLLNPDATIYRDLPELEFERLLAKSKMVAMPLKSRGEACGQSVLLRVLRNEKPLVATRHEAIEAYLGSDYPGFVAYDDAAAMRQAVERALADTDYRLSLVTAIRRAAAQLAQRSTPGQEVEQFLLA